jgi:rhodanese-related sulfurtransferase
LSDVEPIVMLGRLLIAVIALATVLGAAACGGDGEKGKVTLLPPNEFRDAISAGDAFVVNVHIPYEGEIDGTDAFVPFDDIGSYADDLPADKDAPLYIYCRSGRMSAEATPELQALGYTNIIDLEGGMVAWEAAGLEIVHRGATGT